MILNNSVHILGSSLYDFDNENVTKNSKSNWTNIKIVFNINNTCVMLTF